MNASEVHAAEKLLTYLSSLVGLQILLNDMPNAVGYLSAGNPGNPGSAVVVDRNTFAALLVPQVAAVRADLAALGINPDA